MQSFSYSFSIFVFAVILKKRFEAYVHGASICYFALYPFNRTTNLLSAARLMGLTVFRTTCLFSLAAPPWYFLLWGADTLFCLSLLRGWFSCRGNEDSTCAMRSIHMHLQTALVFDRTCTVWEKICVVRFTRPHLKLVIRMFGHDIWWRVLTVH